MPLFAECVPTRRRMPALALLLALLPGACGEAPPGLPPLASDARVLAFGDSLTFGTGAGREQSYPARLADLLGRQVVNAGVPGEVSAEGLRRLPALLDRHRPALLLLCHGGNDMLRRRDLEAAKANLLEMVRAARARSVDVLLIGVPAPGLLLSTAEIYHQVAAEAQVPLDASSLAEVLGERGLKADAVHPNAAGYRELAARIHRRLQELGAI